MRAIINVVLGSAMLLMAACTTTQLTDPMTDLAAIDIAYSAALSAEVAYGSSGKATPAIMAQIKTYRLAVDQVLTPLDALVASGGTPTATAISVAQAALTALQTYLSSQGLVSPNPTGVQQ